MTSIEDDALSGPVYDAFKQLADLENADVERRRIYEDDRLHVVNSFCDDAIRNNGGTVENFSYFAFAIHGDTSDLPLEVLREFGDIESASTARGFSTVRDNHRELKRKFRTSQRESIPVARIEPVAMPGGLVYLPQITEVAVIPPADNTFGENLIYRVKRNLDRRPVSGTIRHGYIGTIELPMEQAVDVREFDGTELITEGRTKNIILARVERLTGSLATRSEIDHGSYRVGMTDILEARRFGSYQQASPPDLLFIRRAQLALELAMLNDS